MPKTILFAANKGAGNTGGDPSPITVGKVPKPLDSTLVPQSIMHNHSQALPFLGGEVAKNLNSQLLAENLMDSSRLVKQRHVLCRHM